MKYKFWEMPVFRDLRGSLASIEFSNLPFSPKRLYFILNVHGLRGGHAHRKEKEIFVCVKGNFKARIHDGKKWHSYNLKKTGYALFTSNMIWHEFDGFSKDAVLLAISSTNYDYGKGYIMNFEEFLSLCRKKSS